jgi:hypothetical protein
MTTILLTNRANPNAVAVSRGRQSTRLLAHLHSAELDSQLADGASPDSSALLSLHAHKLHGVKHRRLLARGFRRLQAAAGDAPHPFDRRTPLARAEIRRCGDLIATLIGRLESGEPAAAAGIAQAELLLSEANSPLYRPRIIGSLATALQHAIDNLAVPLQGGAAA